MASRRHAEALIAAGAVTVNGAVVTTPGTRIDPTADSISVNGQPVQLVAQKTTVAINKPTGYVATAHDPQGRPIVADLLPPDLRDLRLVPVGRLDADGQGLILLSNDGDLALKLTHPRYGTEKEYHALVPGHGTDEALQRLRQGVVLAGADERPTAPAVVWRLQKGYPAPPTPDQEWLGVIIHEGRKRQIRLMFAAEGGHVSSAWCACASVNCGWPMLSPHFRHVPSPHRRRDRADAESMRLYRILRKLPATQRMPVSISTSFDGAVKPGLSLVFAVRPAAEAVPQTTNPACAGGLRGPSCGSIPKCALHHSFWSRQSVVNETSS